MPCAWSQLPRRPFCAQSIHRPTNSPCRRCPPGGYGAFWQRSAHQRARYKLQSPRFRQSLRRRRKFFRIQRRGKPGAHHHGQCAACRRALKRTTQMTKKKNRFTIVSHEIPRRCAASSLIRGVLVCSLSFLVFTCPAFSQLIKAVETIGMTVSDIERETEFFSKVLHFEKISDREVYGAEYEKLEGLFGVRMRIVRMKLGNETIELTEYLAPEGRSIPTDWRSNDQAFQHIAIVV